MAWPIVGKAFSPAEFESYVRGLEWTDAFRPDGLVLHNTASPCLANRPAGLTRQHIQNLEGYYKNTCKWSGGPHLFIDDKVVWVFNDLTKRGTHSPSWNGSKLGIEMLGDFDKESFAEGRGRKVRDLTVAAVAILNNVLGFAADGFKFHCEDKKTDHACPGKNARAVRAALIEEIAAAMQSNPVDDTDADSPPLHIDATEPVVASSTPPIPKVGFRERAKVLQEMIDLGSRLGTSIRGGINTVLSLLVGTSVVGGGAVTLMDPNKGTAAVANETLRPFPVLFVAILAFMAGVAVVGAVAWWYLHRSANGLVTAHRSQRYLPPKQATQDTVEG